MAISKNLFIILFTIMVAMASMAEASTAAAGAWKLKEVWKENEAETLSMTDDGEIYVMNLRHDETNSKDGQEKMALSIKIGNVLHTSIDILDQDKIKVAFVMSTRMFAGTEEKRQLENYFMSELPKMSTMEVKGDGEYDKLLVLSGESGSKIVCEPAEADQA